MILAIPEYNAYPASPAQWDRFYHLTDDKIYIQTLLTTDPSYPNWVQMSTGAAVRDEMRHQVSLTRSQYSAKDFQTYLDQIIAYIAEKWGNSFNDFMSSDAAMMISEYVAASLDQMSFYLDRESDERYMELARVTSNVARIARDLGYKPRPSVAASVDLLVSLPSGPYGFDVTFRAGHQFQGPNGLTFELGSDQTIPAGDTEKTIGVYQGKTYSESFVSTGEANQAFNLSLIPSGEFLAQGKTSCFVGVDEWDEQDFLPYGDEEAFEVLHLVSPPRIRFGSGIVGKIPPDGAEIRVSYVSTKGKSAGFAASSTITRSLTSVVVNFQRIPIDVTNPLAASGGDDPESDESIKASAPKSFMAAERLVTKTDYDTLAGQFSSISGAVAKANSIIIRSVEEDLELKALMDALTSDRQDLDGYMDAIKTDQAEIKAKTGASGTSGTIRYLTNYIRNKGTEIGLKTDDIDTLVASVKTSIGDSRSYISEAKSRLDFMPFCELVGQGDGSTSVFAKTLSVKPILEGSVSVFLSDKTPAKSATDGDCDTSPGRLIATVSPVFSSSDVGRVVRVGGEYRQITKYISGTTVEYSGPRIYGTSLLVDVYPPSIVGYDDGAGNISGSGISGTISYSTGALNITLSVAPEGISGKYGTPMICTYQYKAQGVQDVLDDADSSAATASTDTDSFSDYGDDIDTIAGDETSKANDIDTACTYIDGKANDSTSRASNAEYIPTQIQNDIDTVYEYLDTIISGPCKANVVRVSCLTKDSNGFYTSPSQALIADLKSYLDEMKIRTITNSVVSGSFYLVKVKLRIAIKVLPLFTFQTVSALVEAAIDEMFKNRDYEQPLLRSEYYGVVDSIDGVDYSNITIEDTAYADSGNTDTPPAVDSDGNLFVSDHEVITKWLVTIVEVS